MTVHVHLRVRGPDGKMVEMGMEEGMREAAGQIDALLAEHAHA